MDEFKRWVISCGLQNEEYAVRSIMFHAWNAAWLEASRRADRKARIECAEICRDVHRNYECSRIGADLCKHAIRATIKEPPA